MNQQNWAHWIAGQAGVVPLSMGAPGVAKTACHRALAQATGRRFLPCILSNLMPEDMAGIPVPREIELGGAKIECVKHLLNETMLRAIHEPCIVLIDELTNVSHSMQAAALTWVNEPPAGCWMFAAANPIDQAASGVDLCPPMVNRLCVLEWERPVDAIKAGWKNGFKDYPAPNFPIVPDDYLENFGAYWGMLLSDFADQHPEQFGSDAYPKDSAKASEPWPSDRSWTNVGKLLCAADSVGADSEIKAKLVAGCVGTAAAAQWNRWLVEQNLPDPESILAQPHTLKLKQRFDWNRAVIAGVIGRIRADNSPQRWESGYDVLEVVFKQQPELAMSAEGAIFKLKPDSHTPKIRNGAAAEMRKLRLATA